MKHPIVYRVIFYSAFLILCACVMHLISLLNYAPFTHNDMWFSYYQGCSITKSKDGDWCNHNANEFRKTLIDIDRQMNHE